MRVLFVLGNGFYARNFESVIRGLGRRGHKILVAREAAPSGSDDQPSAAEAVLRSFLDGLDQGRIELVSLPPRRQGIWSGLAAQARAFRDYSRYLLPTHRHARRCAARAASVLIPPLRVLGRVPERYRDGAARAVARCMAWVEEILPADRRLVRLIRDLDPDVVLVTPLIDIGSDQVEYVKACRRLRVPIAHCVASWDNLTNKGLIKALPDRVFVWNEAQEREAIELHGVPGDRISITGAQLFDHWFEHKPSRTRQAFCRKAEVSPDHDIILYTASSVFICRNEVDFVLRWLAAIRGSTSERLRNAGVIIRPHPKAIKTAGQWHHANLAAFGNVSVYPSIGRLTLERSSRGDYYDSLYHCAAVVGINTSAMLEAGIVGRRCFTVLLEEAREGQEGMVHFQHLTRNGFLSVAGNLQEHVEQLARELETGTGSTGASVASFIRPYGLHQPATPVFIAQVEQMEDMPAERESLTARLGLPQRIVLLPFVPLVAVFTHIVPHMDAWLRSWAKDVRGAFKIVRRHVRRFARKIARFVGGPFKIVRRHVRRFARKIARFVGRAYNRTARRMARLLRYLLRTATHAMRKAAKRLARVRGVTGGMLRSVGLRAPLPPAESGEVCDTAASVAAPDTGFERNQPAAQAQRRAKSHAA